MNPIGTCDAVGTKVHHEHEKQSIDEQAEIGGLGIGQAEEAKEFWQSDENEGSNDGTFEVSQTANDDHAEDENPFVK